MRVSGDTLTTQWTLSTWMPYVVEAHAGVAPAPLVEALAGDAVVAAGPGDVLRDLLGVPQDGQAVGGDA